MSLWVSSVVDRSGSLISEDSGQERDTHKGRRYDRVVDSGLGSLCCLGGLCCLLPRQDPPRKGLDPSQHVVVLCFRPRTRVTIKYGVFFFRIWIPFIIRGLLPQTERRLPRKEMTQVNGV